MSDSRTTLTHLHDQAGRGVSVEAQGRLHSAAMHCPSRLHALPIVTLFAALLVGCNDPSKSSGSTLASASVTGIPTVAESVKPASMPAIIVDTDGPYIGGSRVNLADPQGPERLVKLLKELPINGKPVTVVAEKKAKTAHVAAVVAALGDAGAPKVTIKTDGRNDLPKEVEVTPESLVSAPPGCALATMVMDDLSTAIWPVKGGLGKRQRKGLAGPDLSRTGEQLKKDIALCDATTAFFSSDRAVLWESAFNLAGTLIQSDEKKKIASLVLLRETPVAGRAVTMGKR